MWIVCLCVMRKVYFFFQGGGEGFLHVKGTSTTRVGAMRVPANRFIGRWKPFPQIRREIRRRNTGIQDYNAPLILRGSHTRWAIGPHRVAEDGPCGTGRGKRGGGGGVCGQRCLRRLLSRSAVVLATHQLQYADQADQVIILRRDARGAPENHHPFAALGRCCLSFFLSIHVSRRKPVVHSTHKK